METHPSIAQAGAHAHTDMTGSRDAPTATSTAIRCSRPTAQPWSESRSRAGRRRIALPAALGRAWARPHVGVGTVRRPAVRMAVQGLDAVSRPVKGLHKVRRGLIADEASIPGFPCKCTPLSPAPCLTTPSPRCDSMRWSGSAWGWLSISRGNPGPAVSPWEVEVEKGRKKKEATAKTKAVDTAFRLGECAWTRNVLATTIGQRFATSGIADDGRGAGAR